MMSHCKFLLIALALLSLFAQAQSKCFPPELQHQAKDAATIQRLENAWSTAFLKGDDELEKCLLVPEFTEILSDGSIKHLDDELKLATANQGKNLTIPSFPAVAVSLHGNAAAAFGTSESKGTSNKRRWWFVDYYVWENDQWHAYFAQQTPVSDQFIAKQLKTGRFLYRTLVQGKDGGTSEISIGEGASPDTFVYSNHVTGQLSQQWESVAGAHFQPISANLSFGEGENPRPAFDLKYEGSHVTGFFVRRSSQEKVSVDDNVGPDTVDQRIDWAAAISQVILIAGHEFDFHVFDPGSGRSHVSARVAGSETVRVPAGTFQAIRIIYQIDKSSGRETYQVRTNIAGPRMLLKEEFPNGAVTACESAGLVPPPETGRRQKNMTAH